MANPKQSLISLNNLPSVSCFLMDGVIFEGWLQYFMVCLSICVDAGGVI